MGHANVGTTQIYPLVTPRKERERLAEYLKQGGQMDATGVVVLVVFILVIVVVIAYRVGYLWAQVEFLSHNQMLEAKWRMLPMNAPIVPRWRRVAGWAAYMVSALLLCLFLALAYWYAYSWGWTYLLAAWILWFAIFLGVLWLAEWCWRSGREVKTAESEEHPE